MMKRLEGSPEQIKTLVKTVYECFGKEEFALAKERQQLEREEFEYRKERDEKEDYWKARAEELEKKNDELRNKLWEAESNK